MDQRKDKSLKYEKELRNIAKGALDFPYYSYY